MTDTLTIAALVLAVIAVVVAIAVVVVLERRLHDAETRLSKFNTNRPRDGRGRYMKDAA